MPLSIRVETLRRAAKALGSTDALAVQLGVSPRQLERWLAGEETIPGDVFLLAVDLIVLHEGAGHPGRPGDDTQQSGS